MSLVLKDAQMRHLSPHALSAQVLEEIPAQLLSFMAVSPMPPAQHIESSPLRHSVICRTIFLSITWVPLRTNTNGCQDDYTHSRSHDC